MYSITRSVYLAITAVNSCRYHRVSVHYHVQSIICTVPVTGQEVGWVNEGRGVFRQYYYMKHDTNYIVDTLYIQFINLW